MKVILFICLLFVTATLSQAGEIYVWEDEHGQVQTSTTRPEWWQKEQFEKVEPTRQEKRQRVIELLGEGHAILSADIPREGHCTKLAVILTELDNLARELQDSALMMQVGEIKVTVQSYCRTKTSSKSSPGRVGPNDYHFYLYKK